MDDPMSDARMHSHPSVEELRPSEIANNSRLWLLLAIVLMGFALAACNAATGSQEPRVVGETASLGQTFAPLVAATSDQNVSKPQPERESDVPLVSDLSSDVAISLAAELGSDVDDFAYSFTLPSVSGSPFSLDAQLGDKNVVVVFYRAFW